MAQFDWQTEDEATAQPGEQWLPAPPAERGAQWRWLGLLGVLLLVGGMILFLYRQVGERVNRATEDVKQEVLASHDLVRYAAEQRDREVLVSFLSGRDPDWAEAQQDLAEAGLLFDRQSLGLHLLPAGPPEQATRSDRRQVISVTLSPELTEATVSVRQAYTVAVGNGVSETVYLRQESVYRMGTDRWLYAPPEVNSILVEESGRYVVLRYDRQEGETARKLAADLDRKVVELCNLAGATCPSDFKVHLSLNHDPRILERIGNPAAYLKDNLLQDGQQDLSIVLPAPSLVGLPEDEAGYRALYRGYAAQLLRPLLTWVAWPWDCCDHAPVFQALVEQQLVRLGVQPPPLRGAAYRQLLQESFSLLEDTMQSWYGRDFVMPGSRAWLEAQAVISFLHSQKPQGSLAAAAAELNEAANFWFWTYEYLGRRISDTELTEAWLRFAYTQAGLTDTEPPGPWPSADPLLLCKEADTAGRTLYRYEPETNVLFELIAGPEFVDVQPLPNSEGVLLIEEVGGKEGREVRVHLLQGERLRLLWQSGKLARPLSYVSSAVHVSGDMLALAVEGHEGVSHLLLDLATCLAGECGAEELQGRLLWSPDGTYALIAHGGELLLADGKGKITRPVATGSVSLPFWLDMDTYAYARRLAGAEGSPGPGELVAASVTTGEEEVLLSMDSLAEMLPLGPDLYYLAGAFPNLAVPDRVVLAVIAYTSSSSAADLFLLQRSTGEVTRLFNTGIRWSPALAPDGKWLALQGFQQAPERLVLTLHEFESGRRLQFPRQQRGPFAWSPDGRWLLSAGGPLLQLLAPSEGYRQVLVHGHPLCTAIVWAN